MNELPATDLGPYRLEEKLGQGGMGAVYAAVDERLGRRVAVKHLPPSRQQSADETVVDGDSVRRRRFRREAATLARLSHPAIVQIFDVVDAADGDWIVMEMVEGPAVAQLVEDGPLPVAQALAIARRVAEGLAEAHDHGVLHRDLKAENVMLNRAGHAKILDFGLAKVLWGEEREPALSVSGQIIGTPRAMSPEQARGLPLDARSDLFSLGVLLYEMTTAEAPFRADTNLDTLARIAGHPHVPARQRNPRVPLGLSELIDRLLEKSPEQRPASAGAVAVELAELEAGLRGGASEHVRDATAQGGDDWEPTVDFEHAAASPATAPALEPRDSGDGSASYARFVWRRHSRGLVLALAFVVVLAATLTRQSWQHWLVPASPPEPLAGIEEADAYTLFQRGMAYLERFDKPGHLERAIAAFEAALAQDETSAPAHAGLALAYRQQYLDNTDPLHLEQAVAVAEKAVRLDDHLALAQLASGKIYAEAGRYDDAIRALDVALQLDPSNADAYRGLGMVYQRQNKTKEAIAAYEKAVSLEPFNHSFHDHLGTIYYRVARYDDAEREFLASIELTPDSVYSYRNLAGVYYRQGRLAEAAATLQKALEIRPVHSLYANLGAIFFAQGLYLSSARTFEKALEHGGANIPTYWGNLADAYRYLVGHEEQARLSYKRAIQLLEPVLASQPESPLLRSRLALHRAKIGDCGQALSELEHLARLAGTQAEDQYRIAVAYEICGRRDQALATLEEALQAGLPLQEVGRDPELFDLRLDPRYHLRLARLSRE